MQIYIGVSTHKGWFSKLIRWCTNSPVSHAFAVIPTQTDFVVIHAAGLKVHALDFCMFKTQNEIYKLYEISITDEKVRWLWHETGKPYGMLSLFGYAYMLINRKFGRKVKNPLADNEKTFVCSELIAKMLDIPSPETITPQDLLTMMESRSL